jgi:hypothetical protein
MMFRHVARVLRAASSAGSYGGDDQDWSAAAQVGPDQPALFQQVGSAEDVVLQQRTETRWRCFVDSPVDVTETDRVVWVDNGGRVLEVIGEPEHQPAPFATVLLLRSVKGG